MGAVAPEMATNDPTPDGRDNHWKVSPAAMVYPDVVRLKVSATQAESNDATIVAVAGVPEQGKVVSMVTK